MTTDTTAIAFHRQFQGKIGTALRAPLETLEDLKLAYTPGVAEACLAIRDNPDELRALTCAGRTVAVVTDGTAVLGLGDIGPGAGMPVMEGKCALFKRFGGVDAVPICLATKDPAEIIRTVQLLAPSFAGINLEDISAPRCFEIEAELRRTMPIPVFHDDQHGTAIVVLAGLRNALRVVGKNLSGVRIVVNGAGAAGIAIADLLLRAGADGSKLVVLDSVGIVAAGRDGLNSAKVALAERTNVACRLDGDALGCVRGGLSEAVRGADVFIGVSAPGVLTKDMVSSMAADPVIFAMANPTPEIMPDEAKSAGAAVVATGRSDFPNQVNNVLAFPGLFRGAFDAGVRQFTEEMFVAAAEALSALVPEPTATRILPGAFEPGTAEAIAAAVRRAAGK